MFCIIECQGTPYSSTRVCTLLSSLPGSDCATALPAPPDETYLVQEIRRARQGPSQTNHVFCKWPGFKLLALRDSQKGEETSSCKLKLSLRLG